MDTFEHTKMGNKLRLKNPHNNPYLRIDAKGVVYFKLQRLSGQQYPEPMDLELSAGQIIAMAGDYFTQADWTMSLNLPQCEKFSSPIELGKYLIRQKITQAEQDALFTAYNNLASPEVTKEQIALIYSINGTHYIPCSDTLTSYAQQLMLFARVKNYGEMITRNQTHFTPWSIKAYVLGHSIALRYAKLASDLRQFALNKQFHSHNPDVRQAKENLRQIHGRLEMLDVVELAHRFEALAYCVELFTFHYYSDHFSTGHMSMIGDLRIKLGERFGTLGNILANNLHDEVNRVGVFTSRPYAPIPDDRTPVNRSRGDGVFNTCLNTSNRQACVDGMSASIADIQSVLEGKPIPHQQQFGGLEYLPDVEFNVRQHQPLLVLSEDKIYRRQHPSKINIISPSKYDAIRTNPVAHGYVEVSNSWDAFVLVTKLRLFPYLYRGTVQPVTPEHKKEIAFEESLRNPLRPPIKESRCAFEPDPTVLDWRKKKEWMDALDGLNHHSILKPRSSKRPQKEPLEQPVLRYS